ncbi:hypothetical protein [Entomospira culicis]|uniref:Uncharacterized protein n=1 Tax=Entomospira culicis TaxID=2719989 RepID=A0A968GGU4_9SPIO|nr:hypothetical protein [Entomospira culicis]NIZ18577.1 hypothetical protein [Entomospira culicis]NIZ68792.1 hypothetical protein [Entomospira culicis]WDI37388.1 hypothetical protein PVA46_00960 [Entomospira culicis]WDI39017.1 hypothetical protein PVA47_00970 [Entomospira culicis]
MKRESVGAWMALVQEQITPMIYERREQFLLALLVILSGKHLGLRGRRGVGKSFFTQLLEPLTPFAGYPSITELASDASFDNALVVEVSGLTQENSLMQMVHDRLRTWALPIPEFSLVSVIEEARSVPIPAEILSILTKSALELGISARDWADYIDVMTVSAYYNEREIVDWADVSVVRKLGFAVPMVSENGQYSLIDKELTLLELDLENQYRQQQSARKLRRFSLMIKGQESETCRFLYNGEESHMLLSSYQQLLIHRDRYISLSFYQPSGYGLAARPFKESFKLSDDFTLVDSEGRYYELLTEQIPATRHLSLLTQQYIGAQLDAILQKLLEIAKSQHKEIKNIFLVEELGSTGIAPEVHDYNIMHRIRAIKAKISG